MKYRIGFVSLGCPKNLTDTETMAGILKNKCEIVANPSDADIIIVNTCGFIESAKEESINAIIEMGQYKEQGNLKKLIVTGCLAQRYTAEILADLPEVDAVVGTGSYYEIEEIIADLEKGERVVRKNDIDADIPENMPRSLATPAYSAYLKIADGCNNKCTYCIIPKLRGKYRSRAMENIVAEAEQLVRNGATELILIAQDTTMYGIDLYKKLMLPTLIEKLSAIEGLKWIRLHYCYPEIVTDELIEVMANNDKVCKYIDIPFQHASDEVLKRMGRKSTNAKNIALVKRLREKMPEITIRCTFITGFPGETEEDFDILKDFIKACEFERVGIFEFSPEEGTPAAEMEGQIADEVKSQRRGELMELQSEISYRKNQEKIGKKILVLCEGETDRGIYEGRSGGDSPDIDNKIIFKGKNILPGEYIYVRITAAAEYDLEGKLCEYGE